VGKSSLVVYRTKSEKEKDSQISDSKINLEGTSTASSPDACGHHLTDIEILKQSQEKPYNRTPSTVCSQAYTVKKS
jgi:hypothetical protein